MKLKIVKSSMLVALTALGTGSVTLIGITPQQAACVEYVENNQGIALSQEQTTLLKSLDVSIREATELALYLIDSLKDPNIPYKLDEIVVRMESLEPLISDLSIKIKGALAEYLEEIKDRRYCMADKQSETYIHALQCHLDAVDEVQAVLTQLAQILRSGLMNSVPAGKVSPVPTKLWSHIKDPIKRLSSPEQFNRIEGKLVKLHKAVTALDAENACVIKELLELLGKLRHLTEGANDLQGYSSISKRLPKKRAPFTGIPTQLKVEDWIMETRKR